LRLTEAPIEPETKRRTGSPVSFSAQSMRLTVSCVEASLPHDAVWKSDEATIQPLRTSDCSQGSSMRLSTPPVWPWNHTAMPLGSWVAGIESRTS